MINHVTVIGRLTKDVDLRITQSGKDVASFTLASERSYTEENGEKTADFLNCVVWGNRATAIAEYTRKGSLVGVEGRLQSRSYESQGKKMYVTEILVSNYQLLESKETFEKRAKQ